MPVVVNRLNTRTLKDGRRSLISLPDEEWRELLEDPRYSVSSLGRVFGPNGLKQGHPNKGGHIIITFWLGGRQKGFSLNSLVCRLFNGEAPEGKPLALHKNHIPADCRASNLYWGSHRNNADDMVEAGRSSKGEKNGSAKLTWGKVAEIRQKRKEGMSLGDLAVLFKVGTATINSIVKNQTWKQPC